MIGNNINNPIIELLIGELPDSSAKTEMYITFSNGTINTYRFVMNISVENFSFELEYKLAFKNIGISNNIVIKNFENLALSQSAILENKKNVENLFDSFYSNERSSYDFKATTKVDFGATSFEINSSFVGSTKRKVLSDNVYFHNDIEIDSDFKNNDLYNSFGIKDIHIKKTMLSNKEVYIIEKKLFDKIYKQEKYNKDIDEYFLINIFECIENINFIQIINNDDEVIYSIGVNSIDIVEILNYLNKTLSLDPLGESPVNPKVFGSFKENTLQVGDFELKVTVKNEQLFSLEVSSKGLVETKYEESSDFDVYRIGEYGFDISITITDDGNNYEPFDTPNEAK